MRNLHLFAASFALLGACASQGPKDDSDDFTDLATAKADAFSYRMKIVDALSFGKPATVHYTKTPKYRAYTFSAEPGNAIDVAVHSTNGDPVAWVLDSKFKILGHNDDASEGETDSHVSLAIPDSPKAGLVAPDVYYVVVRNATSDSADFQVTIDGGPGYDEACGVDADCAIVGAGGCCPHGVKYIVNASSKDAWADLSACQIDPRPICPLFVIDDTRVGHCDHSVHLCQLEAAPPQ